MTWELGWEFWVCLLRERTVISIITLGNEGYYYALTGRYRHTHAHIHTPPTSNLIAECHSWHPHRPYTIQTSPLHTIMDTTPRSSACHRCHSPTHLCLLSDRSLPHQSPLPRPHTQRTCHSAAPQSFRPSPPIFIIRTCSGPLDCSSSLGRDWLQAFFHPWFLLTLWNSGIPVLSYTSLPLPPLPLQLLLQVQRTLLKEVAEPRKLAQYKFMNVCQRTTATGSWGCRNILSVTSCWPFSRAPERWTWAFSLLGFSISPIPMAPPACVSVPSPKDCSQLVQEHSQFPNPLLDLIPLSSQRLCPSSLMWGAIISCILGALPHACPSLKNNQMTNVCRSSLISPTTLSCYTQTLFPSL